MIKLATRILKYPFTLATLVVVIALEASFIYWFSPPAIIIAGMIALGLIFELSWPMILIRTKEFRRYYNLTEEDIEAQNIHKLIKSCRHDFKAKIEECLALIKTARNEFDSDALSAELDLYLIRLYDITKDHSMVYQRSKNFGTQRQKEEIEQLITKQVDAADRYVTLIREISGNETLDDAQITTYLQMGKELELVSQKLKSTGDM